MPYPLPVERRTDLSAQEFTRDYALPNRPVVLEGLARDWPASTRWTPEFFAERYGHLRVTVSRAARSTELPVRMSMAEYVRTMRTTTDPRPWYLTSWDFTVECPELRQDFRLPDYFSDDLLAELPRSIRPRLLWIFMGPPGSGFRMHVDVGMTSAWNAQLSGRKDWILLAPDEGDRVYNGKVDGFQPDLGRFPRYAQARPYTATLEPGDVIFTPSGWWHQTRILETSVSVTGNYANRTNLDRVLAWLRERPDMADLAERLGDLARGRA
ncbi:MAG: cupin-like domain-containing protein [Candidatus Eremiobacterota bacterium]